MSAKLPGLQPVRTGDPAQDRFLEAVRERLEVREGVRGDPLEAVVLQRDLVELGIKKQSRVALPDGKPGFVTQLADGSFSAISADELVSRLESTDWYRSLASAPGGVTDSTRQSILSAITEEISKRGAEDRRLDSVMAGIREELLRKIGDLAARVSGASAAPPTPNNYDTFTVTLLSDNTRVFTFAYTTTPAPSDLAGAVIRFKKGATGTELWGAMSPLHEGVLTNSPIETRAGDPDVYRFAIKARTRSGMESTDATVRYVDITLPALSGTESIIQLDASTLAFAFTTAGTAYPASQSSILTLTRTPTSLSGTATWSATAFDSSGTQIGSTGGVALTGTGDTRTLTTSNFMAPGGSFDNNIQYVNVTATLGTLSKTVRVIRITDGVEPILSFLTNSSVTLPASSAGVVSSWAGATGDFQVWQGGVEVTTGITYSIQSNPSTLTASIDSSTGVYSVTAAGSWADASNTTSITFRATHTATGATRDAVLTLAKAVAGAPGTVPDSIRLDASVLAFSFDTAGTAYPAAQSSVITLTREPGTIAGTATWSATAFDSSGGQVGTTGTVGLSGSGDSRTLTTGNFIAPGGSFSNNVYYVNVTATLGALSKTVRVIRITDGVEPILSFLTNPAVPLPSSAAGVVSSWAGATGDFQVWQGGVEVTTGITYAIQSNPSTLTASINSSTGVYSVTAAGSWANGSNTTSITFRATHTATGATRDAVFTLTKALTGSDGSAGTPGADAVVYEIEPSVSSVARNNIGVVTPSSVTFYAYSKTGSAARAAFSGRFTIETFIDPTWTGKYTSVSNESSTTYTVPASVTAIRVKLYANGSLSPLLQQVTVPVVPDGIRSPMTLNSNSSATAVYGTVTSGAVNWTDAKGNEVVWRKLGYTSAPSATPADYLVRTDLVTLFDANPPTAGVKPATRYWTGSAWVDPGTVIDGNLLVKGTVTLDAIKSGSTIGTSNVSFGLGVSWGPGTAVSGGYFHSTSSAQFALVCDNIGGGYSIASATTATNDSGAAFAGGGGWTGHTTTGGVTSGGTYTTYGFIATGTAGGIFRYSSTAEARLGEITSGSVSAGRFSQGSYTCMLASAAEAAKAAYSTTQVVYLGTAANAINITAGTFKYGSIVIAPPPNSYSYLDGTGTWRDLTLDSSSNVTSNFTGLRPAGSGANNTWIKFYVGATAMYIPAWYA